MQTDLFDATEASPSIPGLAYQPDFLDAEEEAALLALVQALPLHAARYKQYVARRRVASFPDPTRHFPAAACRFSLWRLLDREFAAEGA